jgi:hypothetical protein
MCSAWHIPIIGITPMHLLEGMSKKRHTRAPYEIHNLEGMEKKDISMLIHIIKYTSVPFNKGQE